MQKTTYIKPLSDAIASPIMKAYKAGGFGLVLIFVGTLLLLATMFFGQGFPPLYLRNCRYIDDLSCSYIILFSRY